MGLLMILFKHKVTNFELMRLDLLVKCSLEMLLINLVIINCIDTPLIKKSNLVQLRLTSFLIRDKFLKQHEQGMNLKLKRYYNLSTIDERERSSTRGCLNTSMISS